MIVTTQRTRKPSRRNVYLTTLQELEKLHTYLTVGLHASTEASSRLNPPQRHPYREGFLAADEKEYRDLERHQTYCLIPNSPGRKLLPFMWTFVYKFDTDGYLVQYEARLCACGDLQEPSHLDTYATTRARVFRTLLSGGVPLPSGMWKNSSLRRCPFPTRPLQFLRSGFLFDSRGF